MCGIRRLWREWRILAWLTQAEARLAVRRRMRLASTSDAAGGVITGVPPLLPPPLLLLTLLLLPAVCGQASWPKLLSVISCGGVL